MIGEHYCEVHRVTVVGPCVYCERDELKAENEMLRLLMAGILAHGYGPHHKGAIEEFLGYPTVEDLDRIILGKSQTGGDSSLSKSSPENPDGEDNNPQG